MADENSFTRGQTSLNNFYQSVIFHSESIAARIHSDVLALAMNAMSPPKSSEHERGQEAAERVYAVAMSDLPEVHKRVLENAILDLGYSLK